MATAASPFFACVHLREKRCRWRFKKSSICRKKLSFWPSEIALPVFPHPVVDLYAVLDLVSGLLSWKRTVCQRSIPAAIYTTDWFGSQSCDSREVCLDGKASKFFSNLVKLGCNTGNCTLCGLDPFYALFLIVFETNLRKHFRVPRIFGGWFVLHFNTDANTVRQGKFSMSKSASFFW